MRNFTPAIAFLGLASSLQATAEPASAPQVGSVCPLVIVGGALKADTADVYAAFIASLEGDGPIVIVPSASGEPALSTEAMVGRLAAFGVPPDRIVGAKLAMVDDPATPDRDEARWALNAGDKGLVSTLEGAAGIWFTGGDQARTTALLLPKGKPSPALGAIRSACARGAVIGGTSAGAAIMSDPMLTGGDSLAALMGETDVDAGAVSLAPGLGFFPGVLVDQHFDARVRLGRLAVALGLQEDAATRLGFGIDENTALWLRPDGTAEVVGTGHVTILDGRSADFRRAADGTARITGLVVSVLSRGDQLRLEGLGISPAPFRKATLGREYHDSPLAGGGGMAVPAPRLADLLGEGLVDNRATRSLERLSFDGAGKAIVFRFTQTSQSRGFWGRDESGNGNYTIERVSFDILPADISGKAEDDTPG